MTKLQNFLETHNLKVADLAKALSVRHTVALRWANGDRIPTKENMQRIVAYTGGAVMPNDFYDLPCPEDNAAACSPEFLAAKATFANVAPIVANVDNVAVANFSTQPNNESEGI